jgi:hypothetical protein
MSNGRVLVFEHVPKCGGSTLGSILVSRYGEDKTFECRNNSGEQWENFKKMNKIEVNKYNLIQGHKAVDLLKFIHRPTTLITLIRNPVDRFISEYFHKKRQGELDGSKTYANINDFIDSEEGYWGCNKLIHRFGSNLHSNKYSGDDEAKIAFGNLESMAWVGITERFDESVLLLWKTLGWSGYPWYAKKNVAPSGRDSVGIDAVREIERRCKIDIEIYEMVLNLNINRTDRVLNPISIFVFSGSNKIYDKSIRIKKRLSGYLQEYK